MRLIPNHEKFAVRTKGLIKHGVSVFKKVHFLGVTLEKKERQRKKSRHN
jgi:hypothetical protein